MIFFLLFSTIYCQNMLKNPSFEEVENNQVKNWRLGEGIQLITLDNNSGKKALYWKQTNHSISVLQTIPVEKGFQYEICAHFKVKNIPDIQKDGFTFLIDTSNKTNGFREMFSSRSYNGNLDWKKACHISGIIKKTINKAYNYYFCLYSVAKKNSTGEIFVDYV